MDSTARLAEGLAIRYRIEKEIRATGTATKARLGSPQLALFGSHHTTKVAVAVQTITCGLLQVRVAPETGIGPNSRERG